MLKRSDNRYRREIPVVIGSCIRIYQLLQVLNLLQSTSRYQIEGMQPVWNTLKALDYFLGLVNLDLIGKDTACNRRKPVDYLPSTHDAIFLLVFSGIISSRDSPIRNLTFYMVNSYMLYPQ